MADNNIPKTEFEQRLGLKKYLMTIEQCVRRLSYKPQEAQISMISLWLNKALHGARKNSPLVLYDMDMPQGEVLGHGIERQKRKTGLETHKVRVDYTSTGQVVITPIDLLFHDGGAEESELFVRSAACEQYYIFAALSGKFHNEPDYRHNAICRARELENT